MRRPIRVGEIKRYPHTASCLVNGVKPPNLARARPPLFRVLLIIAKQLTRIGGKGALACMSKELEDIMEMTGFEHIFPAYKDVEEAVAALSKEP